MRLDTQLAAHWLVLAYDAANCDYRERFRHVRDVVFLSTHNEAKVPTSLGELCDQATSNMVHISGNNNDTSIYGPEGNFKFRCFHDLGHVVYGRRFVLEDEVQLALRQWDDLAVHIPPVFRAECRVVYYADTVAQSYYCALTGEFPRDQTDFVEFVASALADQNSSSTCEELAARYAALNDDSIGQSELAVWARQINTSNQAQRQGLFRRIYNAITRKAA